MGQGCKEGVGGGRTLCEDWLGANVGVRAATCFDRAQRAGTRGLIQPTIEADGQRHEWMHGTLGPHEDQERRSAIVTIIERQRRQRPPQTGEVEYPTGDGKPMAETEFHLKVMMETIQALYDYYAARLDVYVGGNFLLYYVEGDPRKHISPDVLVTLGIRKEPPRAYYLVWDEGKAPDFVIEITSKSTRRTDQKKKFELYRDVLKVRELFLFDPTEDYLNPSLQGFRLFRGLYVPIKPIGGRLPRRIVGLHLEREGEKLRLFDPATGKRLLTRLERSEGPERRAEEERRRALEQEQRAVAAETARHKLAEENDRLRREVEALKRSKL